MSIYVMTVGELAKKRGEPVGEFVKKLQELGVDAGSHAKKLTQPALDEILKLLDPNAQQELPLPKQKKEERTSITNPNVLIIQGKGDKSVVALVDASLNDDGSISVEVVESSVETSIGETLLQFRKLQGMNMGVN